MNVDTGTFAALTERAGTWDELADLTARLAKVIETIAAAQAPRRPRPRGRHASRKHLRVIPGGGDAGGAP